MFMNNSNNKILPFYIRS